MNVIDASALVDYLMDPGGHDSVRRLLATADGAVVVPHHCDLEVVSALRKAVGRGLVSVADAQARLALYAQLPIERFDPLPLLDRVWGLRENFTLYDAAYVALADVLGAPLLTTDARLVAAVERFTAVRAVLG